ncbi:hypothetical protein PHYSODRAFT_505000 [Phytophthora sojae]|uniref:Uncharacterized protein n=1 Tax=Phytophthora sojae (strain P6497) TaxID=1094619 RepID=G4ZKR7_PHYSP|nr:hypothetical protein PHYSODRAFT_505000 [Phytophthora sojae]EGZ14513.1 hypothetical protein PHYSODRAFT_505000 [Phytophthora sojae]|eukprot:XP_009528262.1 hypothetical protein PHYSODRAFT_505000 [Phytophthora sojae]
MRVHNAVWAFAESSGNDWARDYARERRTKSEPDRQKKDTKWLVGHGGKRLRDLWFALPVDQRQLLMEQTPDSSFPVDTDGVCDERKTPRAQRGGNVVTDNSSTHRTNSASTTVGNGSAATGLQNKLVIMRSARANYHRIASDEHMIKLQTAYDHGNIGGVVDALVRSVAHAIHLARSQDRTSTVEETYQAVCIRVSDVLRPALNMTRFEPEFQSDPLSPEFAAARLAKALKGYRSGVVSVHDEFRAQGVVADPDRAILKVSHSLFGKADGIPSLQTQGFSDAVILFATISCRVTKAD